MITVTYIFSLRLRIMLEKMQKKGREPKNQVHQEAILVETIRK